MNNISYRQIAIMVDDQLLSHLSDEALENVSNGIAARRAPDAATAFPGEIYTIEDLDRLEAAVSEEMSMRSRAA